MAEAAAAAAAAGTSDAPRKAPQSSSRKGRRGSMTPSTHRPVSSLLDLPPSPSHASPPQEMNAPSPPLPADSTPPASDDFAEVRRQLLVERSNYEKLMVQMLVLTNDLNEREDQLISMKKREEAYLEQLASKDRMYEQDAMVRMQLGKRLEQVLMDKEEIKDELDDLKVAIHPPAPRPSISPCFPPPIGSPGLDHERDHQVIPSCPLLVFGTGEQTAAGWGRIMNIGWMGREEQYCTRSSVA
jgi:hypothetical protein